MSDNGGANNGAGTNAAEGTEGQQGTPTTGDQGNQGAGTAGTNDGGKTFTQADLDRIVAERLNREKSKFADYDDLKTKAGKFDQIENENKSDLEKANDALTAAQTELAELRVAAVRSAAAAKAGLPAELHEFITATDPVEAEKQAGVLASKLASPGTPAGSIPQGARPGAQQSPNMNDWLRTKAFGR